MKHFSLYVVEYKYKYSAIVSKYSTLLNALSYIPPLGELLAGIDELVGSK